MAIAPSRKKSKALDEYITDLAVITAVINEKNTLETVNELAADKARVAGHVAALQKAMDQTGAAQIAALDAHMKAAAARLKVPSVVLRPTDLDGVSRRDGPEADAQGHRRRLPGVPAAPDRHRPREVPRPRHG